MRTWTPLLAALALAPSMVAAQQPQFLALSSGFSPDPQTLAMKAGGNVEVDEGDCSYGYIAESGGMGLEYTAGLFDLYVYAESDIDTMIVIRTPSLDFICDDDSHGSLNPLVHIEDPETGLYIIFVGGYTQNEYRDATLHISELPPNLLGDEAGRPDFTLDPAFGRIELPAQFSPDPRTVELRAGGDIDVEVGSCSVGFVSDAASVEITYATGGSGELHIYARSDEDTTLLINTPSGEWLCDDDSLGDGDPIVSIPGAAAGVYDVWVGTYNGEEARATLSIASKLPK
jgi:hypothetical protein